jgi:hypothetical protein
VVHILPGFEHHQAPILLEMFLRVSAYRDGNGNMDGRNGHDVTTWVDCNPNR